MSERELTVLYLSTLDTEDIEKLHELYREDFTLLGYDFRAPDYGLK